MFRIWLGRLTMNSTLSALFDPADEAKFLDHFARKEFLSFARNPEAIGALVSVSEINALLASGALQAPRIRVARSGNLVPEVMWSTDDGPVATPALEALMRKGATLVIDNFGPLVPRLLQMEQAIERRLGSRTLINGYLTYQRGGAFAAHYDNHDVLVVQVAGQKVWELMAPVERPGDSRRKWQHPLKVPDEVFWKRTLSQGEMLYIPRGMWHRASVDDGAMSFHLAVTIVSLNGHDYASWLIDQIESDDLIWTDLPRLGGAKALRQHQTALQARIAAIMAENGVDKFLAEKDGNRPPEAGSRIGSGFAPQGEDIIAPALRRALAPEAGSGGECEVRAGGQTHRLTPIMMAGLLAVERSGEGLTYAELMRILAERWSAEAVRTALGKLSEKGLIALRPANPAN
jgi:hypothetical protein